MNTEQNTLTLPLKYKHLAAIAAFASKDETRYTLCGVCVDIWGGFARIIATDGRRIAVLRVPHGEDTAQLGELPFSCIVPTALIALAKPLGKNLLFALEIHLKEKRPHGLAFVAGKSRVEGVAIDGDFPRWQGVIIKEPLSNHATFSFNLELAMPFVAAAKAINPKGGASAYIRAHGPDNNTCAYSVAFAGCADFVGIIMPIRDESRSTMPDWAFIGRKEETKTEAASPEVASDFKEAV